MRPAARRRGRSATTTRMPHDSIPNATGPSAVTFTIGADGVASQVVVENLDTYGAGTFVRPTEATGE